MLNRNQKGFTLIELLVVVAIIGVLASVVLSSLGSARASSRDARREIDIKTIQTALEMYHLDNGHYPMTGWRKSIDSSWNSLSSLLGVTLPVDPINEYNPMHSNDNYYQYFASSSPIFCSGQAYFLVYTKETSNGTGPDDGVRMCNNVLYNYGDTFVVGMDRDGNLN